MFIDNPRDNSVNYAVQKSQAISIEQIQGVKKDLYQDKNDLGSELKEKIKDLKIDKQQLTLEFFGTQGQALKIKAILKNKTFEVQTKTILAVSTRSTIDSEALIKRFKSFNNANYIVELFNFDAFEKGLSIPFKELTQLKNDLAFLLNNSVKIIVPVEMPTLIKHPQIEQQPKLSILIADEKDIDLCTESNVDIYFKLPESFKRGCTKFIDLLLKNPRLIPWFPAVLIGKDYEEAVKILQQVKPERIVSNNTGIAYKAFELNINWVAGPFLNTTNSYALLTLKEELNCSGAFVSNEINRMQIRNISRPENFKLLYSIYHPILMMTSRQCFFQQTVGCKKPRIEDRCMLTCSKATTITNVKGISFNIDKQKGGYPSIYNHEQFLNVDIVKDLSGLFDEFFIDLTDIGAGSKDTPDKTQLIKHFAGLLKEESKSPEHLNSLIKISTKDQYIQGL